MDRKAVFLDVDGTLVNDRGLVPDSARRAVQQARANGHLVFLCTGRSLSALWQEITGIGFDGVIAAAGGYVEVDGEVLAHHNVPVEDVRHLVTYFDHHGIEYFLESNSGLYGSPGIHARLRKLLYGSVTNEDVLAELQRGLGGFIDAMVVGADPERSDINKVFFVDSAVSLATIAAEFRGTFDLIPATVPMLGPNSGELCIAGVHKAAGIETVLAHLGVPREDTLAYGDGLNDLEMLAYVNTGIAMANARPEAKAVADSITGSPDEHGIHTSFVAQGLI